MRQVSFCFAVLGNIHSESGWVYRQLPIYDKYVWGEMRKTIKIHKKGLHNLHPESSHPVPKIQTELMLMRLILDPTGPIWHLYLVLFQAFGVYRPLAQQTTGVTVREASVWLKSRSSIQDIFLFLHAKCFTRFNFPIWLDLCEVRCTTCQWPAFIPNTKKEGCVIITGSINDYMTYDVQLNLGSDTVPAALWASPSWISSTLMAPTSSS